MSNVLDQAEQQCEARSGTCSAVELVLTPSETDLGGFSVRRLLPTVKRRMIGPWIFFDHMGPARFVAGSGIDVRPHPHIGIATVTYLFEGEILHRDSLGSVQPIRPGDINLMVAGRGIVHSERERAEVRASDHVLNGLQLWLALPAADEEMEPVFLHYPGDTVPDVEVEGVSVRVMMGSAWGVTSPVRSFSDALYLEATLQAGQCLTLPDAQERGLYVVEGELYLQQDVLAAGTMAVLAPHQTVQITATRPSRIALIGGSPVGRRYIEWNFVSSRRERIEQAKAEWRAQRFALVPGDDEFIPLP